MNITGKIKAIGKTLVFDSGFRKKEVVITTEEQYSQHILVELLGDRTDIIDHYKIGERVDISINIRGREWINPQGETKYFNSITGWKIERTNQVTPTLEYKVPPTSGANNNDPDEDNDLPF